MFQIGLNPFLNSHAPLILLIKTQPEALVGFAPADSPANPNARKSQQCKRNFHGRAGRYFLITAHRHAAGTELMAGGGEPVMLGGGHWNFTHNRNANIAAGILQKQRFPGPDPLLGSPTFPWVL